MNIISIKESGCNYTLLWALKSGADVFTDEQLQSVVNDELFYLVTVDDINFFQLFRLTQMYREKLRIVSSSKAEIPNMKTLKELFPGSFNPDNSSDPNDTMELAAAAEHSMQNFINLIQQMSADGDIIKSNAVRMFIPMLCTKYQVQIPVGFYDFVQSMNVNEAKEIFNEYYPNTIQSIVGNTTHGVNVMLQLGIVKGTQIIKYHKRYDQYLKASKYYPLKAYTGNELYKFGLVSFHKYDNVSRGEVRCNLFNVDKASFEQSLKNINRLQTPLNVDFIIQLPITYMQLLMNLFTREDLPTMYESSMSSIIEGGISYEDFITMEKPEDEDDVSEEEQAEYEKHVNAISAYRTRITEANQILLNTLQLLLNAPDADPSSAFAMLPPIYTAKVLITLDISKSEKYLAVNDEVLYEMFSKLLDTAKNITEDINKSK